MLNDPEKGTWCRALGAPSVAADGVLGTSEIASSLET